MKKQSQVYLLIMNSVFWSESVLVKWIYWSFGNKIRQFVRSLMNCCSTMNRIMRSFSNDVW